MSHSSKTNDRAVWSRHLFPRNIRISMTRIGLVSTWMLAFCMASAQSADNDFHRRNFDVGIGSGMPLGNATDYLNTAPLIWFGYGYPVHRFFHVDGGFQGASGAANNQNAVITDVGAAQAELMST
jgi:hypothetical protein